MGEHVASIVTQDGRVWPLFVPVEYDDRHRAETGRWRGWVTLGWAFPRVAADANHCLLYPTAEDMKRLRLPNVLSVRLAASDAGSEGLDQSPRRIPWMEPDSLHDAR